MNGNECRFKLLCQYFNVRFIFCRKTYQSNHLISVPSPWRLWHYKWRCSNTFHISLLIVALRESPNPTSVHYLITSAVLFSFLFFIAFTVSCIIDGHSRRSWDVEIPSKSDFRFNNTESRSSSTPIASQIFLWTSSFVTCFFFFFFLFVCFFIQMLRSSR